MARTTDSPAVDLLRLMTLCGLTGPSWAAWRVILRGFLGDVLDGADAATWTKVTGRPGPTTLARELWVIAGRRSGKSLISALLGVYVAVTGRFHLAPGEVPVVMLLASDRKQARVLRRYCGGLLRAHPTLAAMIASETADAITLTTGAVIEIHTASASSVRGYTLAACIGDELAFWGVDEDAPDADVEILNAVRPALATLRGPLICISSPHVRRGAIHDAYRRHFGQADDPVVVVQAPTQTLNPTLDGEIIREALKADEARARAEWLAEFRSDIEGYTSPEIVRACIEDGCLVRPYVPGLLYLATVDPAGGSGADSFTCAIGHAETGEDGVRRAVMDAVHEIRPPFSPETATAEIAGLLRQYRVRRVQGDRFGGDWPGEAFRRHGVTYTAAPWTASEAYGEALPMLNARRVALVDHPRLAGQLCSLERRATRTGRIVIGHPTGKHDDVANVAALLIATVTGPQGGNAVRGLVW